MEKYVNSVLRIVFFVCFTLLAMQLFNTLTARIVALDVFSSDANISKLIYLFGDNHSDGHAPEEQHQLKVLKDKFSKQNQETLVIIEDFFYLDKKIMILYAYRAQKGTNQVSVIDRPFQNYKIYFSNPKSCKKASEFGSRPR